MFCLITLQQNENPFINQKGKYHKSNLFLVVFGITPVQPQWLIPFCKNKHVFKLCEFLENALKHDNCNIEICATVHVLIDAKR